MKCSVDGCEKEAQWGFNDVGECNEHHFALHEERNSTEEEANLPHLVPETV